MKKILFLSFFVLLSTFAFGQEGSPPKPLEVLNIDFKLLSLLYVNSETGRGSLGSYPPVKNFPKQIASNMNVPQDAISLIAKPDEETVFAEKYKGIKLLLVNATNKEVGFASVDHLLYIVQEALDQDGKWKPIESFPNIRCGFGKYPTFLGANEYWEFAVARYSGKIKTKLRFHLYKERPETEQSPIYSNEFEGNINAKQFTVEHGILP